MKLKTNLPTRSISVSGRCPSVSATFVVKLISGAELLTTTIIFACSELSRVVAVGSRISSMCKFVCMVAAAVVVATVLDSTTISCGDEGVSVGGLAVTSLAATWKMFIFIKF